MNIRLMKPTDFPQSLTLWESTPGMGLNPADDSFEGIERYLQRNPESCFVAEEDGRVLGTILAGHDGRRGYIYHLAVAKDFQRQGLGRELAGQAISALQRQGIRKAALVAFRSNSTGNAFWESLGFFCRGDLVYRNLSLIE